MHSLLIFLAVAAAPSAVPPRYDLDCTGGRAWAVGGSSEKIAAHYRVDTVAGRWCRDACDAIEPVVMADAGHVVLKQQEVGPTSRDKVSETVDLSSGRWLDLFEGEYPPGDYWRTEGICKLMPFTPLPAS